MYPCNHETGGSIWGGGHGRALTRRHLPLGVTPDPQAQAASSGDDATQLMQLRKLSMLAETGGDFNEVIMTTLTGLKDGVGLEHCGVFLLSRARPQLLVRIMLRLTPEQQSLAQLPLNEGSAMPPL
ncbi:MAG: hypothetical protein LPH21_04460 [Shewanella sp.]|nr:hypothetical protein [Shewanella sp.]